MNIPPIEVVLNIFYHASPFIKVIMRRISKVFDNDLSRLAEEKMRLINPDIVTPSDLYKMGYFDVADYLGKCNEVLRGPYMSYFNHKQNISDDEISVAFVVAAMHNDVEFLITNRWRVNYNCLRRAAQEALDKNNIKALKYLVTICTEVPSNTKSRTLATTEAVKILWGSRNNFELLKSYRGIGEVSNKAGFVRGIIESENVDVLRKYKNVFIGGCLGKVDDVRTKEMFEYLVQIRYHLGTLLNACDNLEEFDISSTITDKVDLDAILVEKASRSNYNFVRRFIRYSTIPHVILVYAKGKYTKKLIEHRIRHLNDGSIIFG